MRRSVLGELAVLVFWHHVGDLALQLEDNLVRQVGAWGKRTVPLISVVKPRRRRAVAWVIVMGGRGRQGAGGPLSGAASLV